MLNGFAVSWFFAPYIGSADMDFFKRIKDTSISYTVAQVGRDERDDRVLQYASTSIRRMEIPADHRRPRTAAARRQFSEGVLNAFETSGEKFDFIISHSNEIISHDVAEKIKKRHPELPWIAYFGDLFARNPYVPHIRGYPLVAEDTAIERSTLRNADLVILNNEYQRDLMFSGDMREYASKCVIIPHCFDEAMYPDIAEPRPWGEKFVFAHLGTLYHVKRTAAPVLQAVDRLLDIYPRYRDAFEIRFYGGAPCDQDRAVHRAMRESGHVRFEAGVPYIESLGLMRQADALLLIDGMFSQEEDGLDCNPFLPGKLADYMGACKPIASITMSKGPTADIMKRAGNLWADQRIDRISYVLKRYLDRKIKPDYSVYAEYSVKNVAQKMEEAIRSIVRERG